MNQTEQEVLSTVDTGPPVSWCHIGNKYTLIALCGEQCGEVFGTTECATPAGMKDCPDCWRIYGNEDLLWKAFFRDHA